MYWYKSFSLRLFLYISPYIHTLFYIFSDLKCKNNEVVPQMQREFSQTRFDQLNRWLFYSSDAKIPIRLLLGWLFPIYPFEKFISKKILNTDMMHQNLRKCIANCRKFSSKIRAGAIEIMYNYYSPLLIGHSEWMNLIEVIN